MALERIVLNIIPAGEMPVFHCSQYENGRPVIIDLVSSDDDAFVVPEGSSVELHCRKVDDNIVTLEPDEVDQNTVTFVSTEQLTACPGDNLCEIVLYSDTDPVQTIATLNFILHVEPDPLEGGLTSETQIYNLTEQIEEITQQVIGDDYYNKTEVDGLLDLKADKSDTYTKSQVDTALNLKANSADLATVATTGDYDDLINKPTIPAAQVQSDYAQADNTQVDYIKNKPDINAMIAAALLEVMPVGTASGPIASFDTELAASLVNVSCDIVATQGPGTPSPSNPLPISGYTEANITANGSTVTIAFGQTVYGGVLDVTRGKLTVTHSLFDGASFITPQNNNDGDGTVCFILASTAGYKAPKDYCLTNMLELSNQNWNALPKNSVSISNATYIVVCSDTPNQTLEQFKTWFSNNVQLLLQLATPFDIDLTPEVISAVVGENNVYSDTNGDTTVQFKDSIQHYIDTRV